jgi:hypothetical protein
MAPLCQYRDAMTEICFRYIQNKNGVKSLFRFNYAHYAHILTVTVIFGVYANHDLGIKDTGRLCCKSRKINHKYVNYFTFHERRISRKGSAAARQDPEPTPRSARVPLKEQAKRRDRLWTENYFFYALGFFCGTGMAPDCFRGRRRGEAAAARPGENPPPRSTPSRCSRSPSP